MPIPLIPAIISSIIEGAADQAPPPPAAAIQQQWPAAGVVRVLPPDSLSGTLSAAAMGAVVIDGKELPLSPAGQIRNQMNAVVVPSSVQEAVPVRYVMDGMGYVSRIWILTPAELAASR